MIIKLEQDLSVKDVEILIKYAKMNKDVERITAMLKLVSKRIPCSQDGIEKWVNVSDIYYIESVDKKTFLYGEKSVYRVDRPLYQLADELVPFGFVQINKSCTLNLNVLDSIKTLVNSRMEATLKNGERLLVTRKYLDNIKRALTEVSV